MKEKIKKITNSIQGKIILSLFFFLPLIFSYLPDIFGIHNLPHSRFPYESVKVGFFIIMVLISLFSFIFIKIIKRNSIFSEYNNKYIFFLLLLFLLSTFFSYDNIFSIYGSPEKTHGLLFFSSLLLFFLILVDYLKLNKKNKYLITYSILLSFIFLFLYSVIQFFSLDPLQKMFISRVPSERIFSSLGNPNYLAGYLLIILPLVFVGFRNKFIKASFTTAIIINILLTRSLIGIFIMTFYLIFLLLNNFKGKPRIVVSIIFLIISGIIFHRFYTEYNISNMKLYSFFARFYLWKSVFLATFSDIKTILIGNGFDTIYLVFNKIRDPMLSIYEDKNYIADSSHNFLIDILFFVGFIGFFAIFIPFFKILKSGVNSYYGHSIILFLIFFSFNVAISVHIIVIIYCFAVIFVNNKNTILDN